VRRRAERGAETLELVCGLPLLGAVVAAAVQWAVLAEEHARAASDARELVRHQVVCEHRDEPAARVAGDALLSAGRVTFSSAGDPADGMLVTATVVLPPRTILPGLPRGLDSPLAPRASATMRREPC